METGPLLTSEDTMGVSPVGVRAQIPEDENGAVGQNTTPDSSNSMGSNSTTQQPGDLCFSSAGRSFEAWTTLRHSLSCVTQETLQVWNGWRFVKSGCITAQEAVTYVDLFFQNMSPLSPILHDYYQDHSKHLNLITREPVLCCTIIALSARYHLLAGEGNLSRGYYIHDRLWKHCQSMFQQIVWDQRRAVKDQIRHLGTMESFLLVTEWHPRSAHLPIDSDDWQSDARTLEDEWTLSHSKGIFSQSLSCILADDH